MALRFKGGASGRLHHGSSFKNAGRTRARELGQAAAGSKKAATICLLQIKLKGGQ